MVPKPLRIPGSPTQKYHAETYGKGFRYEQFAPLFEAGLEQWDPEGWAELFSRAGARYVVLVRKHHDGYLMCNSRHPNPRNPVWQVSRDVAGELTRAVQARGTKMGFYYSSLLDWSFTKSPITSVAELLVGSETGREYLSYIESPWRELIERYDPWILWSDKKRIVQVNPMVKDTQHITITGQEVPFSQLGGSLLDQEVPEFTGTKQVDGLLGYSDEAKITISQNVPLKMTVLGLDYRVAVWGGT